MSDEERIIHEDTIYVESGPAPQSGRVEEAGATESKEAQNPWGVPAAAEAVSWGDPPIEETVTSEPAATPWGRVAPPNISPPTGAGDDIVPPRAGLSTGAIVAIVAGVVIVLLACCCFAGFMLTALIGLSSDAGYFDNPRYEQPYIRDLENMIDELEIDRYYFEGAPNTF